MTYRRHRKAKFYVDEITARINRGRAITNWALKTGTVNSGYDAYDLIDLNPSNVGSWDTTGNASTHVIHTFNSGLTSNNGIDCGAVLNHNLATAGGVIRFCTAAADITGAGSGNTITNPVSVINGTVNPDSGETITSDITDAATSIPVSDYTKFTVGEFLSFADGDVIRVTAAASSPITVARNVQGATASGHTSGDALFRYNCIKPAADGDTLFTFDQVNDNQYWSVQFIPEGAWSTTTSPDEDLTVGAVIMGRCYTMPVSADLAKAQSWNYGGVDVRETDAGKRHAHARWLTGVNGDGSSIYRPFSTGTEQRQYGGRWAADLSWTYMDDTDLLPSNLDTPGIPNTNILSDVLLRSLDMNHRPFIFALDSASSTEGDYIWARIAQGSLNLQQETEAVYSVSLRIEQEL